MLLYEGKGAPVRAMWAMDMQEALCVPCMQHEARQPMKGGRRYPFTHSKYNEIRTYGLRFHFGGWIYFEYQRRRLRRIWRKRARREAKRWIEEQVDAATLRTGYL